MANEVDAQKMMAMLGALYDVDPKPPQRKEGSIRGGKTRQDVANLAGGSPQSRMTAAQMPRYAQDYLAMMGAKMPNMRSRPDGGSMAGGALNIPYDMHDAPLPSRKEGKKPRPSRQEAIAKAQESQRRRSPQSADAAATAAGVDRPNTGQAMREMLKNYEGMDWYEYPSGMMRSAPARQARNNIFQMPAGLVEMLMANVFDPYATPNMAEPDYSDYPPRIANQRMIDEVITNNSLMNRLRLRNLDPLRSYEDRSQRGV